VACCWVIEVQTPGEQAAKFIKLDLASEQADEEEPGEAHEEPPLEEEEPGEQHEEPPPTPLEEDEGAEELVHVAPVSSPFNSQCE